MAGGGAQRAKARKLKGPEPERSPRGHRVVGGRCWRAGRPAWSDRIPTAVRCQEGSQAGTRSLRVSGHKIRTCY